MKFLRQQYQNDCGPMAVFNALRWAGASVSLRKDYPRIKRQCRYHPAYGVYSCKGIVAGLGSYRRQLKFQRLRTRKLADIDQVLARGHSLLFLEVYHEAGEDWGHFSFFFGRTPCRYKVANRKNTAVSQLSRARVSRILARTSRNGRRWAPYIFVVKKAKN